MSDVYKIEANTVEFEAPFGGGDVILKNSNSNNALRVESDLLVKSGNFVTLGNFKIEHDSNKLSILKNGVLKMTLE